MKKHPEATTRGSTTKLIWLILLLCAFFPSSTPAQRSNITIGTEHKLQSRILGEERRYVVNLPGSYQDDDFYLHKKYPVLILLDGDTHFHSASGAIRFMGGNEQIPEMIVVAVLNTNRTRDLTPTNVKAVSGGNDGQAFASSGGGDKFLRFLETELLPQISKTIEHCLIGYWLGILSADCLLSKHSSIKECSMLISRLIQA